MYPLKITAGLIAKTRQNSFFLCGDGRAMIAGLIIVLCFCFACSPQRARVDAERATDQFHERLKSGQYAEIYLNADELLLQKISDSEFKARMDAARQNLGDLRSTEMKHWLVTVSAGGTITSLTYRSVFAAGVVEEHFLWINRDGRIRLVNYNVGDEAPTDQ